MICGAIRCYVICMNDGLWCRLSALGGSHSWGGILGQDLEDLAMDGRKNEEGEDARGSKRAARVVS